MITTTTIKAKNQAIYIIIGVCLAGLPISTVAFSSTAFTASTPGVNVRVRKVLFLPNSHHAQQQLWQQQQQQQQQQQHQSDQRRTSPLYYRALDEDDDPTTMLKVQTRAPPGFDMREAVAKKKLPKSAMNLPLIRALLINQVLILGLATAAATVLLFFTDGLGIFSQLDQLLHWTGAGPGLFDLELTPFRLIFGAVGALPIIALGYWIESSDNRAFANVNFSTIVMTMTLFGRRKAPPDDFIPESLRGKSISTTSSTDAFLQSLALSVMTGLCEETVFRAEVPALLTHYFGVGVPLAILGQAVLFGLGHAQPGSSRMENGILVGLQFVNGLAFGLIYVLSGGDVVPCMVAHALYDFVTFFKTWMDANGQLEYAERMFLEPLPSNVESEVRRVMAGSPVELDPRVFKAVKRLFYTFDFDKNKTLSRSEVRKGVSYLALEKAGVPPPQEIVDRAFEEVVDSRDNSIVAERDRNRLSFSDFIRLYSTMFAAGRNIPL